MKKIIILAILFVATLTINAQCVDDLMVSLSKEHKAENVKISSFLMALIKPFTNASVGEAGAIINSIKSLHAVNLENCNENQKNAYTSQINNLKDSNGYERIVRVKDGDENVSIIMKRKKDKIESLYILCVDKNEISAVKINGSIKDEDIQNLIAKHNN